MNCDRSVAPTRRRRPLGGGAAPNGGRLYFVEPPSASGPAARYARRYPMASLGRLEVLWAGAVESGRRRASESCLGGLGRELARSAVLLGVH
jgi:hypothetical protein